MRRVMQMLRRCSKQLAVCSESCPLADSLGRNYSNEGIAT
jgi:hypothetical protein